MEQFDEVKRPAHYIRGGMECIDVVKVFVMGHDGFEGHCMASVVQYLWRWKYKNGLQDLKKAREFLDFLIKYVEEKKGE